MSILEVSDIDRPYRGRRLSWREFYALRPDLKADNDNDAKASMDTGRLTDCAIASQMNPATLCE